MTEEEKKQQKELWKQDRIRARREEWKKIKSMGTGAKLQYLWDYYKIVLAIAIGLAFTAYLIVTIIQGSRMSTILYTCFLNVDELDPDTETLREDYIRARGGTKKTENITFDSSVVVNPDSTGTTQQDVAASIKITSYTGAGALDVFLQIGGQNAAFIALAAGFLQALNPLLPQANVVCRPSFGGETKAYLRCIAEARLGILLAAWLRWRKERRAGQKEEKHGASYRKLNADDA